jgi:hypothetical protein
MIREYEKTTCYANTFFIILELYINDTLCRLSRALRYAERQWSIIPQFKRRSGLRSLGEQGMLFLPK